MRYRLVVGETGNEQGHIVATKATSELGARIALGKALGPYQGDGWGRIEINYAIPSGAAETHNEARFWERLYTR